MVIRVAEQADGSVAKVTAKLCGKTVTETSHLEAYMAALRGRGLVICRVVFRH